MRPVPRLHGFRPVTLAAIERVRNTGRPLLVTKRGVPVAQVLPPPKVDASDTVAFGSMAQGTEEIGDILEPLPSEDWEVLK